MKCARCEQENPPQAKFCLQCANPLALQCASCGTSLPAGAKFCFECAAPVAGAKPMSRFVSPEAYTPEHLAERIINSKAALEGERKQVTVLFADLKGSMELLADRDPEEAREILDPVLELMMEAVHRYEGTVNQVMGDGIMALFGAPLALEDHAVRACYAALRMQQAVKRYAEGVRRQHGVTIHIRVGLNSGEVVVRAIGSDLHMDYTAVGETTHLAARMEQIAAPGSIVLAPSTLALAAGFVHVTPRGPVTVKGRPAPVDVYELTGAHTTRSRLQVAAARGFSRFVGRDAEVEQLGRAVDRVQQGRGQVVAIVGEPGVGKSRVTFELTRSPGVKGWLILETGAVSYGTTASYLPVVNLLKRYFGIGDRDTRRDIQEKATRRIRALDPVLEPILPAVLALFDVADDPSWQALDPTERRQQTLDAVKRLLLREARVKPLLVVFEDLHWIDAETQAVLDGFVESLPAVPLLLLVNYRPEYTHRWGSKASYTQIRLDPLAPGSARLLLHELLGADSSTGWLASILIDRTEGNPFFLEENIRALVETNALVGERSPYRLARPLTDIEVPATVHAILAARIDRLSPDDKRVLQSAAVIGTRVPFALLAAIADAPENDLLRTLARLTAAEFLFATILFPDPEYTFAHALTHEVAYRSLLRERRRQLHARTAEAIERVHAELLGEHVERLVDHAVQGELWDKVVVYGTRAGTRAADRSAHPQTVKAFFETALDALGRLPEKKETIAQAIELRCLLTAPYFALGDQQAYVRCMNEALELAGRLDDEERLARVLAIRTNALWFAGDLAGALESGERAVTLAEAIGHSIHEIHATLNLGLVCGTVGDRRPAVALFTRAVSLLHDGELERQRLGRMLYPAVFVRNELATSYAELGQFEAATAASEEALRIAEAIGHSTSLLTARLERCRVLLSRGGFVDAIPQLEGVRQALQEAGAVVWATAAAGMLGYSYAMTGRLRDGVALLREALDQTAHGRRSSEAHLMTYLGEALLEAGQSQEALGIAEHILDLSRQRGERATEARALHLLGEVAVRGVGLDAWALAERHFGAAMALARKLGMRPLIAHCHVGHVKVYRRTRNSCKSEENFAGATTMYREMGMTYWLEKAETEMAGND